MSVFKSKIKNVLIDLSGTLHIENESTPGAVEALNRLRNSGLNLKFVTNTTKESRRVLYERLVNLGFDIKTEEIFSCLLAARSLIERERLRPLLLVDDSAMEDFKGVDNFEGEPNAVVVGLAPDKFDYHTMNKALRILIEGGRLVGIHEGRYYRIGSGQLSLGPGPFVRALAYAASVTPTIVGKPSKDFFLSALQDQDPSSAIMIGDDARDDVQGAGNLGISGILVRTGKYRPGDETRLDPTMQIAVSDFSEAVQFVIQHLEYL